MRWRFCLCLLLVVACEHADDEAVVAAPARAGLDSADPEMAAYLAARFEAAATEPASAEARGNLAMAYDINGLNEAALPSYEQAHALDPTDFRWPYFAALLLRDRGAHERAIGYLDAAVAIDGDYPPAWLWRGTLLLDLGRTEEAAAAFQVAEDAGAGPPATLGLARARQRLGQSELVVEALQPLSEDVRHPAVFRLLGRAYQTLGRTDEAEMALIRGRSADQLLWFDERKFALWEHAASFSARLTYAQQLLALGESRRAVEVLEMLRDIDPQHEVLLNNLAAAYGRDGSPVKARGTLEQGIRIHPKSFSFYLNLAYHYWRQEDDERALESVQDALALSPDLSQGHELMGEIMLGRDRRQEAVLAFKRAQSPRGYYFMGVLAGSAEDWPRAIDSFQRSLALDPSNAMAHLYLGRALAESGRFDAASASLSRANALGISPDAFFAALQRLSRLQSRQ